MNNIRSEGRFLKIANIVVLVLLLGITGLLAIQNWRLRQELAATKAPVVEPVPLPAPMALSENPPAPAPIPATKKAPSASAAKRNYTQPARDLAPAVAARTVPPPAPIARVIPTDVIPAEPMPFPRSDPQASPMPGKISVTIPPGTIFAVRLLDTLSTDRNQSGDRFRASLQDPIISDGNVIVPRGTTVEGRIVDAQQAGRVKGVAEMTLELSQLRLSNGETVVLETGTVLRQGQTSTGKDAAKVGAGAAIGAVIGAISGGGKGAAIGAATGGGAGTAGVLLTRGEPLVLGPETILSFALNSPVTLEVSPDQSDNFSYTPPERRPSNDSWDGGRPRLRRR